MNKQVLLINDLAGYGKVALSAMMPVLSHLKINIYNLPTALVSNTLDYGEFAILDTTDYMQNTLSIWKHLGFHYDAISTGFILHEKQASLIADYCIEQSKKGVKIFCDPIMGDDGKLYNGVNENNVIAMRKLVACSDYIVPNYTEAVYLCNKTYIPNPTKEEIINIINDLKRIGAKSVVITSVCMDGLYHVVGYDQLNKEYFFLQYEYIDVRFPGTGDIFSAMMLACIMKGFDLKTSVKKAMDVVKKMILKNLDNKDKYKGILIESCLEVIDNE